MAKVFHSLDKSKSWDLQYTAFFGNKYQTQNAYSSKEMQIRSSNLKKNDFHTFFLIFKKNNFSKCTNQLLKVQKSHKLCKNSNIMQPWSVVTSVTRFGKILPLWRNFTKSWAIFEGLLVLGKILNLFWQIMCDYYLKWPNFEK